MLRNLLNLLLLNLQDYSSQAKTTSVFFSSMEEQNSEIINPAYPSDTFQKNYAQSNLDSFLFSKKMVDTVIERGSKIIYNHYLHKKLPAYFAKYLGSVYEELQVQEIRSYDPGETVESYLINWMEEEEPVSLLEICV